MNKMIIVIKVQNLLDSIKFLKPEWSFFVIISKKLNPVNICFSSVIQIYYGSRVFVILELITYTIITSLHIIIIEPSVPGAVI